ncbi:hypothetical protein ACIQ7N_04895 [Lysinibacillus sp. NPDC095746]|uniref:hypothetical protein n=1 Tax=Lysinibacillus sp. NPDC095746 TaxID=3364134 RepID=UPI0038243A26
MQQQQMFSIREIDSCGNSGFLAFFARLVVQLYTLAAANVCGATFCFCGGLPFVCGATLYFSSGLPFVCGASLYFSSVLSSVCGAYQY